MKSVYRRAAESLVNRKPIFLIDYSCHHLEHYCGCPPFKPCDLSILYEDYFRPREGDLNYDWWNKRHKSPRQLLAASLALLFMEYLDV